MGLWLADRGLNPVPEMRIDAVLAQAKLWESLFATFADLKENDVE
jgi:hypothetical protein